MGLLLWLYLTMWLKNLWEHLVRKVWEVWEISSERVALICLRLFCMGNSDQSLKDQKINGNRAGKDRAGEVSSGKRDCTGCWTPASKLQRWNTFLWGESLRVPCFRMAEAALCSRIVAAKKKKNCSSKLDSLPSNQVIDSVSQKRRKPDITPAGSRLQHYSYGAGFRFTKNARVLKLENLLLWLQKAWKARHCAPECEAVKVKSKIQWSFQDIEKATNLEYLRKVTRREQRQPKREATGSTTQWDHSSPLAFICHHKLDLASGHVWNYRI